MALSQVWGGLSGTKLCQVWWCLEVAVQTSTKQPSSGHCHWPMWPQHPALAGGKAPTEPGQTTPLAGATTINFCPGHAKSSLIPKEHLFLLGGKKITLFFKSLNITGSMLHIKLEWAKSRSLPQIKTWDTKALQAICKHRTKVCALEAYKALTL